MNAFRSLGLSMPSRASLQDVATEHVVLRRPLDRIFAFTGFSIDDIVDNPIAKNAVLGYFKLQKHITRSSEIVDLERQWNP
jgi:hypothetical protein